MRFELFLKAFTIFAAASFTAVVGLPGQRAAAQTTIVVGGGSAPANASTLHLTQRVERSVPRTRAQQDWRIELAGNDPNQLQTQIAAMLNVAIEAAKKFKDVTIEPGAYAVMRQTPASVPNGLPAMAPAPGNSAGSPLVVLTASEWRATQLLSITSSDGPGLAGLVTALENQGIRLAGMRLAPDPEAIQAVHRELTAQALAALRAQADALAAAMDMRVARATSIDVTSSQPEAQQQQQVMQPFGMTQAPGVPTLTQTPDGTIWVSINANFQLVPKGEKEPSPAP